MREVANMTTARGPRRADDMRPLGVGDAVKVLRSARLPAVEEVIAISVVERVTRGASGESLYWVRGFPCARTGRELRLWKSLAEVQAEQDEAEGHD